MDGKCPVGIDNLTPEILRALWLKNTLAAFSELGVGSEICRTYDVGAKDFDLMSRVMAEERAIEREADADRKSKDPEGA